MPVCWLAQPTRLRKNLLKTLQNSLSEVKWAICFFLLANISVQTTSTITYFAR